MQSKMDRENRANMRGYVCMGIVRGRGLGESEGGKNVAWEGACPDACARARQHEKGGERERERERESNVRNGGAGGGAVCPAVLALGQPVHHRELLVFCIFPASPRRTKPDSGANILEM